MRANPRPPVPVRARVSRLRLRLSAAFTATFVLALAVVAAGSLGWIMRESTRRLDGRLAALGTAVSRAIFMRSVAYPDSGFAAIVDDVRRGWVVEPDGWIVLSSAGVPIAATMHPAIRARILAQLPNGLDGAPGRNVERDGDDLRVMSVPVPQHDRLPAYTILTVASTEPIERDAELLMIALAVAAPLIALVSLLGGYLLSRWALTPIDTLGRAIDALAPAAHGARLPVSAPPDEIGQLAMRFNALLDRLMTSQAQNLEFVREAAHQIRTPLTLVRGEAELARRSTSSEAPALREALARIERASHQMQRRVDELFLLAAAEAGATLEQRVPVEVDALALDGMDLFLARAAQAGQPMAFGTVEPATVLGDPSLLNEALLELLENACRHGRTDMPIVVSVQVCGPCVHLGVESYRLMDAAAAMPASTGLGQRIVRWIADVHDGQFSVGHDQAGRYLATLALPLAQAHPAGTAAAAP